MGTFNEQINEEIVRDWLIFQSEGPYRGYSTGQKIMMQTHYICNFTVEL